MQTGAKNNQPDSIIYDYQAIEEVSRMGYWASRDEYLKFALTNMKQGKAWRTKTREERHARERFEAEMRAKFWSNFGVKNSPVIANLRSAL